MSDQPGLFPESATVVDETKRKPEPSPRSRPEWRKLPGTRGLRPKCSQCALERWRGQRQDVNRVTHKRTDVDGSVVEFCDEHAEQGQADDAIAASWLGGRP